MKLSEVRDTLRAEVLTGEEYMDRSVFGGGGADLMEDILATVAKGAALLTGVTTEQVIRTARIAEVGAVIFVRGKRPGQKVIDMAKSYNLPVMLTEYSMFVSSGRLYMNGLRGLDGSW